MKFLLRFFIISKFIIRKWSKESWMHLWLFLMCWDDWHFCHTEVFKCWSIDKISFMGKSTVFLSHSRLFFLRYSGLWLMFCIQLFFFTLHVQNWAQALTAILSQDKCNSWDVLFCRCSLHIIWKTFLRNLKIKAGKRYWM